MRRLLLVPALILVIAVGTPRTGLAAGNADQRSQWARTGAPAGEEGASRPSPVGSRLAFHLVVHAAGQERLAHHLLVALGHRDRVLPARPGR